MLLPVLPAVFLVSLCACGFPAGPGFPAAIWIWNWGTACRTVSSLVSKQDIPCFTKIFFFCDFDSHSGFVNYLCPFIANGQSFEKTPFRVNIFRKVCSPMYSGNCFFGGSFAPCLLHPLLCVRFVYVTVSPKQQQISGRSFEQDFLDVTAHSTAMGCCCWTISSSALFPLFFWLLIEPVYAVVRGRMLDYFINFCSLFENTFIVFGDLF